MFANVQEAEDRRRLPDDVLYIEAYKFSEEARGAQEEKVLFGVLLSKWSHLHCTYVGLTNDEVVQVQDEFTILQDILNFYFLIL